MITHRQALLRFCQSVGISVQLALVGQTRLARAIV
jgi:hypothetical protein